ncbi:hypothetical protein [Halogeometricum luteum]|uniref:Uncharacterized protein n=1 Tax=Halogeometricum luteum TaxID=2950537 RepID=A0ABU2FZT5_9EURY|nr:hypothetical protein [Halogeometricum sp. S3BR5-2]MDS0294057.1 hypothetical protein [Halogeometricum sp. S3BR5-2]
MDRERVVVVCMGLYALALVVDSVVEFLTEGVTLFGVVFAAFGLFVLVTLARSASRGTTDDGIQRIADSDLWFWSLVVLFVLGIAGIVLDLTNGALA